MRLPNGEHAVIDERKLLDYLLNAEHPIGRHHAILFERLLGLARENADLLREGLVNAAMSNAGFEEAESP